MYFGITSNLVFGSGDAPGGAMVGLGEISSGVCTGGGAGGGARVPSGVGAGLGTIVCTGGAVKAGEGKIVAFGFLIGMGAMVIWGI